MLPMQHFDLIIIGSGSGNSIADDEFSDKSVAIIDHGVGSRESFGGTCLNVGCIPTKMFVHTADIARAPQEGTHLGVDLTFNRANWSAIRDRIFGRIDPIADGGRQWRTNGMDNVTLFEGTARFTGTKILTVKTAEGDKRISGNQIVVASGSRPIIPSILGLEETGFHTSDSVMRLEKLPERMIILGTGFIAAELAHVFDALGVAVTVVGRSGQLLRAEDEDISLRFTDMMQQRWDYRPHRKVTGAERTDGIVRLTVEGPDGAETIEAEELLVAIGRVPNSDLIDATAGGLKLYEDGRIHVDAQQRTSVEGVWALGDVSSPYQLKHVANHEAKVVRHNLLNPNSLRETDHRFVPHAVFTSPQIASVGLTESQAQAQHISYVSAKHDYADIAYGWAMEDRTGFIKLLADPDTGLLLGAHIIGPQAPTLIQTLIQAMTFDLNARDMAQGQYWIHPAMPELVENALLKLPLNKKQ